MSRCRTRARTSPSCATPPSGCTRWATGRALLEGLAADLLLFDPATVGRGRNRRLHDLPAGASRLRGEGVGVHGVWVNGEQVADRGGLLADAPRAGQLLRSFSA